MSGAFDMPIDPSISLQVRKPEFMTPAQGLALRDMVQKFTMGNIEMAQARSAQQSQIALQDIARAPGMIDEQTGLPTPQYIQRVAQVDPKSAMELGKQRMVTMQAMSAIQGQQALVDQRNSELANDKYKVFTELREASVPAYELAKQGGASDDEAERQYREAWQNNAERMLQSGRLNFLPQSERDHYATTVPPYSLAKAGTLSMKDIASRQAQQEEQKTRAAERVEVRAERRAAERTKAEEREEIRAEKKDVLQTADRVRVETVEGDLGRLETATRRLLEHPGLEGITGVRGMLYIIPGSARADANTQLNSLKSRIFINTIASMREASKTGGAVGNVTEREGDKLEASLGSLERAQSYEQIQQALRDIIEFAGVGKKRIRGAYEERWEGKKGAAAAPGTEEAKPLPGNVSDYEPGTIYQTPKGPGRFTGQFKDGKPVFERPGAAPAAPKAPEQPQIKGCPPIGTVARGFRFKGGNCKDRSTWEKL